MTLGDPERITRDRLLKRRSLCHESPRCGGRGAILSGLFHLGKGQILRVLCGGSSARSPAGGSGGGGGTYVIVQGEDDPLIVAGGGGGTRFVRQRPLFPPSAAAAAPARSAVWRAVIMLYRRPSGVTDQRRLRTTSRAGLGGVMVEAFQQATGEQSS